MSSAVNCQLCACVWKVKSPGSRVGCHAVSRRRRQYYSPGARRQLCRRFHLHGVISWSSFSWWQVTFPTTNGLALLESFQLEKNWDLNILFPNFLKVKTMPARRTNLECRMDCDITLLCKHNCGKRDLGWGWVVKWCVVCLWWGAWITGLCCSGF